MPIAYVDGVSGASGDMLLGALLDAGWPLEELHHVLRRFPLQGWGVAARRVTRQGLAATRVSFDLPQGQPLRHLHDLLALLDAAALAEPVRNRAEKVLRALAEAEAAVHGSSVEEVHFHEVGALDTLFDVVGVVAGLEALAVEELAVGPLNVGGGTVRFAHGLLPVPPPAVALLCRGLHTYGTAGAGELLTPTGAAILATLGRAAGAQPPLVASRVGYGAGQKELAHANVVRLLVGERAATGEGPAGLPLSGDATEEETAGPAPEHLVVLSCNLDDMNPEFYPAVSERLFAAGALDAWMTPISMKKGRPAVLLSVLGRLEDAATLRGLLFRETTTLGVRTAAVRRDRLERRWEEVETAYGAVRVKLGLYREEVLNRAPEYEDCAALARERGVPVKRVYAAALAAQGGRLVEEAR